MKVKNNNLIDLTKFIMSIMVLIIHTKLFGNYLYPFIRIAVPFFFTISSYLFFRKINDSEVINKKSVIKKFIIRNLQLYFFWFIILFPITLYARKYYLLNPLYVIPKILHQFLTSSTFLASWYIVALIIGIVSIEKLCHKLNNKKLFLLSLCMYVICLLTSNYSFIIRNNTYINLIFDILIKIFGYPCNNFIVSFIWIVLGKIIAESNIKISNKKNIFLLILSFILLFVEHYTLKFITGENIISNDCYILLIPIDYFLVKYIVNHNVNISNSQYLRNQSTINYCLHFSVSVVIDNILEMFGIWNKYNILNFIITLMLVSTIGYFIQKLEKNKTLKFLKYSH